MNSATTHAPRAVKRPVIKSTVFADFYARDLQRRFAASDNHVLRRWERIVLEARA